MRFVFLLVLAVGFAAGCSDPCNSYCNTACEKMLRCENGQASDADRERCTNACMEGIDDGTRGTNDSSVDQACRQAEEVVKDVSCDQIDI